MQNCLNIFSVIYRGSYNNQRLFIVAHLVLSGCLSSLQAVYNLKYDHPILVMILELYIWN